MKYLLKVTVIIALMCSCASSRPLYHIDMSGRGYPEIDLKLSDIADVKYVKLTNSNSFKDDPTIHSFYDESHSIYVNKKGVIIRRRQDNMRNRSTTFLGNGIYKFNKKGEFIASSISDTTKSHYYGHFDVKGNRRIYIGMEYANFFILNKKMDVKRHLGFEGYGSYGLFFINRRRILSFGYDTYFIRSKKNGKIIEREKLYHNPNYRYFFRPTSTHHSIQRYYAIPISPFVVNVKKGYLIPSVLTDTIKFISKRKKISPYIINSNPRFDTSNLLAASDCVECKKNMYNIVDKGGAHSSCEYGQSVLWIMYPTVETEDYIFFNSASKGDVYHNNSPKYYVFNKSEKKMYILKNDNLDLLETALAENRCYFNHRNLTLSENMAVEFFPYNFLRDNKGKLPKELKEEFLKLTENDSGVLMMINLK